MTEDAEKEIAKKLRAAIRRSHSQGCLLHERFIPRNYPTDYAMSRAEMRRLFVALTGKVCHD